MKDSLDVVEGILNGAELDDYIDDTVNSL